MFFLSPNDASLYLHATTTRPTFHRDAGIAAASPR
jgi:hypothetical protein